MAYWIDNTIYKTISTKVTACAAHAACLSYGCNATHRFECGANRAVTLGNVNIGGIIKASDIEILRANTINEIDRWNQHVDFNFTKRSTTGFSNGSVITASKTNNLVADLSGTGHGTTPSVSIGSVIYAIKLASNMLSLYNSLRTNCICNSYAHVYASCVCNGTVCYCHSYS